MPDWRHVFFYYSRVRSRLRIWRARLSGTRVGAGCAVGVHCEFSLGLTPPLRGILALGDRTRLDHGVILHPYGGNISIGDDVYIGPFTTIYGHGGVLIGKDTLISMHCRILSSDHAMPATGTIIRSQPDVLKPTRIGADVWLGAGVTVLGGVTIGDGCVVGAGAVVTKDLPPRAIATGVPAEFRKTRQ